MATNNNGNLLDTAGNVYVDFAWGNFPMQPNDERTSTADYTTAPSTVVSAANATGNYGWSGYTVYPSSRLNPTLSFHDMAEAKYAGFPDLTTGDGAYISGVAYISVPNVLGLTTALAIDALRDAGYETGNITTASAAANAAGSITDIDRTAGSTTVELTGVGFTAAYPVGTKITVASTGTVDGTWTVTGNTSTNKIRFTSDASTVLTSGTGSIIGVAGTIKTQSTAAGANSVASTATITVTPWAAAS
jgi:hypothetical protein